MVQAGYGSAAPCRSEDFLAGRERGVQGLVTAVQFTKPQNPSDFRFRKVSRVKPKGISVM